MAENNTVHVEITQEDKKDIHMSRVTKGRKSITYLQNKKKKGEKIVQVCPATLGPWFAKAAEMADCDIMRVPALCNSNNTMQEMIDRAVDSIRAYRQVAKYIHMNFFMDTPTYATKERAVVYGSQYMFAGADSLLCQGLLNDTLKYMSDNLLVTYGHIGAISGWQTMATGYVRLGKTAEDAMRIFKMGYEYQENGMGGMTIELTPHEVSAAIAKKLRVPVLSIAGSAACDGSEMVDMDTFGLMPTQASHSKKYADFFEFATTAYAQWANDVRTGAYPEEKHCWHMDPVEAEKFNEMIEKF